MQVLNHVGVLNLPDWWNAGKVAQDNSPIPFSESLAITAAMTGIALWFSHTSVLNPFSGPASVCDSVAARTFAQPRVWTFLLSGNFCSMLCTLQPCWERQQGSSPCLTCLTTAEFLTRMWCCRNADRPGDLCVQLCGDQEVAGLQEAWQPGGEGLLRGPGGILQGLWRERLPWRHL